MRNNTWRRQLALPLSCLSKHTLVIFHSSQIRPSNFLKPFGSFKKAQYQVVCVCGLATEHRYEMQKLVDRVCEKVPALYA